MLLLIESRQRALAFTDNLRSLLVAQSPSSAKDIFPEWFPKEIAFEEARRPDGTYDIDKIPDAAVEWSTPATVAEREELEHWIAQRTTLTVSAADLDEEGGWT